MNNKTSEKNVDRIEKDIERCKQLTKPEHASWIGISNQLAISHILAEREQDKKRIKELEEELEKANRQLDLDYVEENFIPKQQVKGKLKELKIERDKIYKEFIESNRLDKQLHVQGIYLDAQIIILQELLEGEK